MENHRAPAAVGLNGMLAIPRQRLQSQQLVDTKLTQPGEVVRWLVAIQAQDYAGAKWSVGLRLPQSLERDVEQAIAEAKILRTWAMRGTLHFVAPQDIRWLMELLAPRIIAGNARRYRELELDDRTFGRSNAVIVEALAGGKRLDRPALVAALEQAGIATVGQRTPYLLQRAALSRLICQGVMRGSHPTYFLLDELLPQAEALPRQEALAELALRYFTSRGPAAIEDFIWWSGLSATEAKAGLAAVKALLVKTAVAGQTYWLPPHSAEEIRPRAARLYLFPGFDEYLLSYQDRSAVMDVKRLRALTPANGMLPPTIVWAGRVIGTWKRTFKKKGTVFISPKPYDPLNAAGKQALVAAAQRYGEFLGMSVELDEHKFESDYH